MATAPSVPSHAASRKPISNFMRTIRSPLLRMIVAAHWASAIYRKIGSHPRPEVASLRSSDTENGTSQRPEATRLIGGGFLTAVTGFDADYLHLVERSAEHEVQSGLG